MKTLFRAVRRFLLGDLFIRLIWLILIICLLVLVIRGITVTHKSYKPQVKSSRYNPFIEDMKK